MTIEFPNSVPQEERAEARTRSTNEITPEIHEHQSIVVRLVEKAKQECLRAKYCSIDGALLLEYRVFSSETPPEI